MKGRMRLAVGGGVVVAVVAFAWTAWAQDRDLGNEAPPLQKLQAFAVVMVLAGLSALLDIAVAFKTYPLRYLVQGSTAFYVLLHALLGASLLWVGLQTEALSSRRMNVSAVFVVLSMMLVSKAQFKLYGHTFDISDRVEKASGLIMAAIRDNVRLKQEEFSLLLQNYYAGRLDDIRDQARKCLNVFCDNAKDESVNRLRVAASAEAILDIVTAECGEKGVRRYFMRAIRVYPARDLMRLSDLPYWAAEALAQSEITSRWALARALARQDVEGLAARSGLEPAALRRWCLEARQWARTRRRSWSLSIGALVLLLLTLASFARYVALNRNAYVPPTNITTADVSGDKGRPE